ncbi:MAG: DUF499 domain-containing protein, partial [Candidatus Nanohaloarchaea archaeon]
LSQNRVTLEDQETKTVTLTASSDVATAENFNVRAASTTSYSQDIRNIQFNVENCYESEVSVTPTEAEVAGGSTAEFDVTVRNIGTKEDEFTLSSNIGEFSQNPVEIDGESNEVVTLEVTPEQLGSQTVEVTAEGKSSSSNSVQMEVLNGNNMNIDFEHQSVQTCDTEKVEVETIIENTGATDETFSLQTNRGVLEEEQIEVEVGESEAVETTIDAKKMEAGAYDVVMTATASTYGEPQKSGTASLTVNDCFDVTMNVVPEVASAGENRSVIYEINLENTGTKENTYELAYEGPSWISIKPGEVTVSPGETGKSYMYAGIPFKKEGNVQITATAVGENATDSQTVELVIGQEIEEAIKSETPSNGITGQFADAISGIEGNVFGQAAAAILIALLITAAILVREW